MENREISFHEKDVEELVIDELSDVSELIIHKLCGKDFYLNILNERDDKILCEYIKEIKDKGINYNRFNELLLLLNQHKVSEGFFDFFFNTKNLSGHDLKNGIIKFRGYAMLCFGNFRFAYKTLKGKNKEEIEDCLRPYSIESAKAIEAFQNREECHLPIESIDKDKTWLTGYISKDILDVEKDKLQTKAGKVTINKEVGDKMDEYITSLQNAYPVIAKKSVNNTDRYLAWCNIDVYVATSMRSRWEFKDVNEFIENVFQDQQLQKMKIRYFDPTQSQCSNRFDKGLVESLVLKRSMCTLYMVQEGDTFGKDSELAITLALGKPVIAYVPKVDVDDRTKRLHDYPLEYFQNMFYKLKADGFIDKEHVVRKLKIVDKDYYSKIFFDFLHKLKGFRDTQPITLYEPADDVFKMNNEEIFGDMCSLLALLEKELFDNRAYVLRELHPLSLQVNLSNGVANGVLVVRDIETCRRLLYSVLTNSLEFSVNYTKDEVEPLGKFSYYYLKEKISGCPYRVVTEYKKLTNSYWNMYFDLRSKETL